MIRFAIRDDDVHVATRFTDLKKLYDKIWEICPVNFAIIPCVSSVVLREEYNVYKAKGEYFIGINKFLTQNLKKLLRDGQISVLQHGFSHESKNGQPEFMRRDLDLIERMRRGKILLEDLFEHPVRVFVPPHNMISRVGYKALKECRMDLLLTYRRRLRRLPLSLKSVKYLVSNAYFTVRHARDSIVYPYVMCFNTHREFGCYGLYENTSVQQLLKGLEFCLSSGHNFCLAVHHKALLENEKVLSTFRAFWDEIKHNYHRDLEFVAAELLFDDGRKDILVKEDWR